MIPVAPFLKAPAPPAASRRQELRAFTGLHSMVPLMSRFPPTTPTFTLPPKASAPSRSSIAMSLRRRRSTPARPEPLVTAPRHSPFRQMKSVRPSNARWMAEALNSTPATRAFTVDTKAPGATILKKPKGKVKTKKKAARVKVSFKSEAGAAFECRLDSARFKRCASPFRARAKSASGKGRRHKISVRATDSAGNAGKVAAVRFRVIRTG